jgi:hypothetical protein
MRRIYIVGSLVLFVAASGVALFIALNPPQQHGRGMGAALLVGYVMIGWLASAANLALALIVFLVGRKRR